MVSSPVVIYAELESAVKVALSYALGSLAMGGIMIGKGYVDLYKVNKRGMEAYAILEQSPLSKYENDNSATELSDIKKLIQDEAQLASYLQHINQYNRALRDKQDVYVLSKNIKADMNGGVVFALIGIGGLVGARWMHIELNKIDAQ